MDPGMSINFDAVVAVNSGKEEEEEAAEDAKIKQLELQELLTNAFDDLLDEDDSYDQDSELHRSHHDPKSNPNSQKSDCIDIGKRTISNNYQTSTPVTNYPPALETPSDHNITNKNHVNSQNKLTRISEPSTDNCSNGNKEYAPEYTEKDDRLQLNLKNRINNGEEYTVEAANNGDYIVQYNGHGTQSSQGAFNLEQQEYLDAGGEPAGSDNSVQLQILYKARGREIDALNSQLESIQDHFNTEVRVMKHELALMEETKQALSSELDQANSMLNEYKTEVLNLEQQQSTRHLQIEGLQDAIQELVNRNGVLDNMVENLQKELKEIHTSQNLARLREQHESFVENLTLRHQKEVISLNEMVDSLKQNLENKNQELQVTHKKCDELSFMLDKTKVDKSEIINRLTMSLEACQNQCKNILESGTTHEVSRLKMELQNIIENKNVTENLLKTCQEEVRSLRQELFLYEGAAKHGAFANLDNLSSDSIVQMGLTSNNRRNVGSDSVAVAELKGELSRCLNSNKIKRHTIIELKENLSQSTTDLKNCQHDLTKIQKESLNYKEGAERLKEQIDKLNPSFVVPKDEYESEIKKLKEENDKLQNDYRAIKDDNREAVENEYALIINKLKEEMRNMIKQHDQDKQAAIQRCQETGIQLQEAMGQRILQELHLKFEDEKNMLYEEHNAKVNALENQLTAHLDKIDELKKLFIQVCKEKSDLIKEINELKNKLDVNQRSKCVNEEVSDGTKLASVKPPEDGQGNGSSRDPDCNHCKDRKSKMIEYEKVIAEMKTKLSVIQHELSDTQIQNENLKKEVEQLTYLVNSTGKERSVDVNNGAQEKIKLVEKELNTIASQKQSLENELRALKRKWSSESRAMQLKYGSDLKTIVNRIEEEKIREQNRVVKEIKREANVEYGKLTNDHKECLGKIRILEEQKAEADLECQKREKDHRECQDRINLLAKQKEEFERRLAEYSEAILKIRDSFQHKLKEESREKDDAIIGLENQLKSLSLGVAKEQCVDVEDLKVQNQTLENRVDELKNKIKNVQKYAINKEKNFYGEVTRLKTEFTMTVDSLKEKIELLKVEQNNILKAEVEKVNEKHDARLKQLRNEHLLELERCKYEKINRGSNDVYKQLKESYLAVLFSIKDDVIEHIQESNSRAGKRMKSELMKLVIDRSCKERIIDDANPNKATGSDCFQDSLWSQKVNLSTASVFHHNSFGSKFVASDKSAIHRPKTSSLRFHSLSDFRSLDHHN